MKLSQLFSIYPQLRWGQNRTADVKSLCIDSRLVEPGSVYVALRGHQTDGHQFLQQAIQQGAIGLVVEDESAIPNDYQGAVVRVENTKSAIHHLANHFFGHPADQLFCVGVTGTNGKTTVTHMIEAILNEFGWPTGVMGTVDHHLKDRVWESALTTPDPLTLHKRLQEFLALDARAVAFEVSSHALAQGRADHIPFDVVVFTNLTRDHLDYHRTMEDYFVEKQKLFKEIPLNYSDKNVAAVINVDDPFGRRLEVAPKVKVWAYGRPPAPFAYEILAQDFSGSEVSVSTPRGDGQFHLPLVGEHNVQNAMAAVATGMAAGASLEVCLRALSRFNGVRGRLERVSNSKGIHVFVDYAHTDDALNVVLKALQKVRTNAGLSARIITVFGCGGDRDRGKRPLMAQAAVNGSDVIIITSDNPRFEDPRKIIDDVLLGVKAEEIGQKVFVEPDRAKAIAQAIDRARPGDVVLVAGKGHETYQIVKDKKLPFDDVSVAKEVLGE